MNKHKYYGCLISWWGVYHVWVLTRPGEYSSVELIVVGVLCYSRVVRKDAFNIFRVLFGGIQRVSIGDLGREYTRLVHSLCSQILLRCLRFFWRLPFGGGGNGWPGLFGGILCLGGGFGDGTFSLLLNVKSTNLNNLLDSFDSLVSGKTISDSRGKAMLVLELGSGRGTGGLWARVKEHNASDKSDKEFGIFIWI